MNLEKELIALSNSIMFDDAEGSHQLDTYSPKVSELLLRCATEIESISKDLYYLNGGERKSNRKGEEIEPKFDFDCLKFLDDAWQICSKQVSVSSANFFFTKPENKVITPLKGVYSKNGCLWNEAYQAVKHYRATSMNKATVRNLIHAMAALYVLNIYYRDEETLYRLGRRFGNMAPFDNDNIVSFNSEVFSLSVRQFTQMGSNVPRRTGRSFPEAVYIRKYTDNSIQDLVNEWYEPQKERFKKAKDILTKRPELKEWLEKGGVLKNENAHIVWQCLGRPLLNKMNALKTFEEQKKFLLDRPSLVGVSHEIIEQVFPNDKISFTNKEISTNNIEAICVVMGASESIGIINSEFIFSDTPEHKEYLANGGAYDMDHIQDIIHHFGRPLLEEMNKLSTLEEKIEFVRHRPNYSSTESSLAVQLKYGFPARMIPFDGKTLTSENIEPICLMMGCTEFVLRNAKNPNDPKIDSLSKPTEVVLNKGQKLYTKVVLPEDWFL